LSWESMESRMATKAALNYGASKGSPFQVVDCIQL